VTDFPDLSGPPVSAWSTNPDGSAFRFGNVGVNLQAPSEALSVGGNVLVSGDVLKPSDMRIKRNIKPVTDSAKQLQNIQNLAIYDYERVDLGSSPSKPVFVSERGFLAQEVKVILPHAVRTLENVNLMDAQGFPLSDMLVVNDRDLLVENIGATQELGKTVQELSISTRENTKAIEQLSSSPGWFRWLRYIPWCKFSMPEQGIFNLGPSWSYFVIGFFYPLFWIGGLKYMCSPRSKHHLAGLLCFFLLAVFSFLKLTFMLFHPEEDLHHRTHRDLHHVMAFGLYYLFAFCVLGIAYYVTRPKKRNPDSPEEDDCLGKLA